MTTKEKKKNAIRMRAYRKKNRTKDRKYRREYMKEYYKTHPKQYQKHLRAMRKKRKMLVEFYKTNQ